VVAWNVRQPMGGLEIEFPTDFGDFSHGIPRYLWV
jgi:hypothetical protein